MLSECARGVFCVAEVKPSRWVYIMNLIGVLASKWKYLWYLHLEYTGCTNLKFKWIKEFSAKLPCYNKARWLQIPGTVKLNSCIHNLFLYYRSSSLSYFELPNLLLIVMKDYGAVCCTRHWSTEDVASGVLGALDIVHLFGQSALSP